MSLALSCVLFVCYMTLLLLVMSCPSVPSVFYSQGCYFFFLLWHFYAFPFVSFSASLASTLPRRISMCRHSFFFAFPVYYSPWVLPTLQGFLSFLNSFVTCFHIRHRTNKNSVLAALKRVGFPEVSCKSNVKAFFPCGIQK